VEKVSVLRFLPHSDPAPLGWVDERLVRQLQQLGVQGVVEHPSQLLGAPSHRGAQIGSPHVSDEQRVAAEHCMRVPCVGFQVVDEDRDRLRRVTWRLEHLEADAAESHGLSVGERRELVLGVGARAEVDAGILAVL
jgi:hypothetical protein